MNLSRTILLAVCVVGVATIFSASFALPARLQQSQPAAQTSTRRIGTIRAITGESITLAPDSGSDIGVTLQDSTRILRIAPGDTNLKNAIPIQLPDLQVGDRILVGGKPSDDAKTIVASSIVMMKHSDVEARQQQELQDWQKRGAGGLVSAVDEATRTVTISVTGFGGAKTIAIHTTKSTVIRRYAPDSVKFDDAKPSSLTEIHPGDQLRARGDRSAGGADLAAEEIVTGSFRNLAGIVNSVDANTGIITVQDLLSKQLSQVKVTKNSQLHRLQPEIAQRIAARLKGSVNLPNSEASPSHDATTPGGSSAQPATPPGTTPPGVRMRSGGPPDLQQMLTRLPPMSPSDLHKGDAVLIVATRGEPSRPGTAITLLSGVEPILQAAPTGSQAMMLSPWNLGGSPSGDANQ